MLLREILCKYQLLLRLCSVFCLGYFSIYNLTFDCFGADFYEINSPVRNALQVNYQYNIDNVESTDDRILDAENVRKAYVSNANKIYAEKKETDIKLIADKDEADKAKRQKFLDTKDKQQAPATNVEKKDDKKNEKKSWIDDWLPETSIKPFEMVGAYTSFKIMLIKPMSTNISATEKRNSSGETKSYDLFSGKTNFKFFPAFFVAIGNDRFKWFRWEVELGYLPLWSTGAGTLTSSSDMSNYTFTTTKDELSVHLTTLALNGFIQHDYFNKNLVFYIGMGIGVGYGFSFSKTLGSNFVMPIINLDAGFSFMVGKKAKINLGYRFMYSTMSMPNRYAFTRSNQYGNTNSTNRAILGGSLKFDKLFINAIVVEYQFYTA